MSAPPAGTPPSLPGVEPRWVEVRGTRLHVAEAGSGPPLVLLHGWPQGLRELRTRQPWTTVGTA